MLKVSRKPTANIVLGVHNSDLLSTLCT